ncbi:MAG: efflux RND transporter permease subunit [Myxococcota bacterium]
MNALTLFIRRPVLATMLTALLMVLGAFSYIRLGVDLMPKIEFPIVTVTTVWKGASPEEVEAQITKPIEEAVNTASGIDELRSSSMEGVSRVVIRFKLERPIAAAVQDIRDRVATIVQYLPQDAEYSVIREVDIDSSPILTVTVSSDKRDLKELSEIARLKIKESLENVSGVGAVYPSGNWTRAINIFLDTDKLRLYNIPISKIKTAISTQNIEIPSGRIDRGDSEFVLRTMARIDNIDELKQVIIQKIKDRQITLGDVATIEDSVEEPRTLSRIWDKKSGESRLSVALQVVKQSGTNTVEVVDNVKKRINEIRPTLPEDIRLEVVGDQSVFIKRSLAELNLHLILGAILASLMVLFFMRNLRATIIASIAIPTSIIATFTFMKMMNFTLNNMTLLGLTLAVGIVIDDAIVVLENIYRHMEEYGKSAFQAAQDGLKEIGLAVIATTTSLVVIFLPVAFMEGMVGRFFNEFGLTTAVAIAVSLIISLTLTPMLSSIFLRKKKGGELSKENKIYHAIEVSYKYIVEWGLKHPIVAIIISVFVFLSTFPILSALGKDFLPMDDRGEFLVNITVKGGSTLSTTDSIFKKVEKEIQQMDGVILTLTQIGSTGLGSEDVTQGSIYVQMVDLKERNYSQMDVMRKVRGLLKKYPELRTNVSESGGMTGTKAGYTFSYEFTGPDLKNLMKYSDIIVARLREDPGFVDIDTSLSSRQPEVRVHIDRQRAMDLGVTPYDLALTLRTLVAGDKISKYREGVEQYDIWLRLNREWRDNIDKILNIPVISQKAGLIPISYFVRVSEGDAPTEIKRFNRQRLVSINANLEGIDLNTAINKFEEIKKSLNLPAGYTGQPSGKGRFFGETISNFLMAFVMAFIFMYIVLAAQFESFLHPFIILLSLPLTLPFAFLSLLMLREYLNLYSILGVFMLFGIVKKNGILQVDYTNTLRSQGKSLVDAIIEANLARLRPILMTTFTLIAGMIPIALGTGPGAAARASLAKVIIGGQALSLVITLLIVPVSYYLIERFKERRAKEISI